MRIKPLRPLRFPERYLSRSINLGLFGGREMSSFGGNNRLFSSIPDGKGCQQAWNVLGYSLGSPSPRWVGVERIAKSFQEQVRSQATSRYELT
jgi:hypothetical protein